MRTFILCLFLAVALAIAMKASAAVIVVDPNGGGSYLDIEEAVNSAVSGDVIELVDAVYTGFGNRGIVIAGKRLTIRSQSGNPDACIIDCDHVTQAFTFNGAQGSGSALRDITIREGLAAEGGAVYLGVNEDLAISNCKFIANLSSTGGGAIRVGSNSNPTFEGCLFDSNSSGRGGAIYATGTQLPLIRNCRFTANTGNIGGAIAASGVAFTLIDGCTFSNNVGSLVAGAIYCENTSTATMVGCRFESNRTNGMGGHIGAFTSCSLSFTNCDLLTATAGSNGGAIYCSGSSPLTAIDTRFTGNSGLNGGAVHLTDGCASDFNRCRFTENTSTRSGGAIYGEFSSAVACDSTDFISNQESWGGYRGGSIDAEGCPLTLSHCRFEDSVGYHGGAVFALFASPVSITACEFIHCRSFDWGGAVGAVAAPLVMNGCTLAGNVCTAGSGGAIRSEGSDPNIDRCTFYHNQSINGAAVYDYSSTFTMSNCILAENTGSDLFVLANAVPTLSCCDLWGNANGDWIGAWADQLGLRGNLHQNPRLCNAPHGIFTLDEASPCLAGSCGGMGAWGAGCTELPSLVSVLDLPNDQGRQVRLRWQKSSRDALGEIFQYGIYRKQSQYSVSPPGGPAVSEDAPPHRMDGWDYVGSVPARGDEFYQTIAPTVCDSNAVGNCFSTFFVSAMTQSPLVYYDSAPDSGYSIDNLSPSVPANLHWANQGAQILAWNAAPEADFDYFTVYGSETANFGDATVMDYTTGTTVHVSALHAYYFLTATDVNGNEGGASRVTNDLAAVEASDTPLAFALLPPSPNPSSARASVRFDLPHPSDVDLAVFDAAGRRVVSLISGSVGAGHHQVAWNGQRDSGGRVAPGVYFVRLQAGDFLRAERITIIR